MPDEKDETETTGEENVKPTITIAERGQGEGESSAKPTITIAERDGKPCSCVRELPDGTP